LQRRQGGLDRTLNLRQYLGRLALKSSADGPNNKSAGHRHIETMADSQIEFEVDGIKGDQRKTSLA